MFPDWETIKQHWEVIKFALDLSSDKDKLIHIICKQYSTFLSQKKPGINSYLGDEYVSFSKRPLKNYLREEWTDFGQPLQEKETNLKWFLADLQLLETLPQGRNIDPLHNEYFYLYPETDEFQPQPGPFQKSRFHVYITSRNDYDNKPESGVVLFKDTGTFLQQNDTEAPVNVESYSLFGQRTQAVVQRQRGRRAEVLNRETSCQEGRGEDCFSAALKLLQEFTKHQTVTITRIFLESKNNKFIVGQNNTNTLHADQIYFPHIVVASQIIHHLHESKTAGPGTPDILKIEIGFRRRIKMIQPSNKPDEVFRRFLLAPHTGELKLEDVEGLYIDLLITEPPTELGDVLSEMKHLKRLNLSFCDMQLDTRKAVMKGLSGCTQLEQLSLTHDVYKGMLSIFFGGEDHPGFPHLQKLDLNTTELDPADLEALREAVKQNKLPRLQKIDLHWRYYNGSMGHLFGGEDHPRFPWNKLTGKLKHLFGGEDHPGFPTLQEVDLENTKLDTKDLQALGEAVKQKKLPMLQKIDLGSNHLTGSLKHLFGGEDHPGFPSLQELYLGSTGLNAEDLEALGEAMKHNKLPQLQKIYLQWCCLTGTLKHWFGEKNHAGLVSLQELDVSSTHLDTTDLEALGEAVKQNKLPILQKINLKNNELTGCLKFLFGGEDHPGFRSLQELDLPDARLDDADVEALSEAVKQNKLPQIQKIVLGWSKMRGDLSLLFGGEDHPGFPTLQEVDLRFTDLGSADLEALSEAMKQKKLPMLRKIKLPQLQIDLHSKKLRGILKHLFGGEDHPGFPSLEELNLNNTELATDVEALSEAVKQKKLPQLQKIDLGWNKLTGSLKHLFEGEDHPGFPSLQKLDLKNTKLNASDFEALGEAVKQNKLPQLKMITGGPSFYASEETLKKTVRVLAQNVTDRNLHLCLIKESRSPPWETAYELESLCQNTRVSVVFVNGY